MLSLSDLLTSRIIPALAGNTIYGVQWRGMGADHPRSRGEYSCRRPQPSCRLGSSPLSRGIPGRGTHSFWIPGIIPALAGNTARPRLRSRHPTDHPRSRGEYSGVMNKCILSRGSSPLSRGIPDCRALSRVVPGIIPALAGNTTFHCRRRTDTTDHPRSRGEYP